MVNEVKAVEEIIHEEQLEAELTCVLTISEVAHYYHKSNKTVHEAVEKGWLKARKSKFGAIWLVSKKACDERWPDYGNS